MHKQAAGHSRAYTLLLERRQDDINRMATREEGPKRSHGEYGFFALGANTNKLVETSANSPFLAGN